MIEALVRLLLSCFAVLFLGGVVLLFLSLTAYALFALINPNISSVCFFLLINYLFSMILSVCLCSLHCILHLCVCFSFRSRFALPVYSDNSHTLFLAFVTFSSGKKSLFPSFLLCGLFSLFFPLSKNASTSLLFSTLPLKNIDSIQLNLNGSRFVVKYKTLNS